MIVRQYPAWAMRLLGLRLFLMSALPAMALRGALLFHLAPNLGRPNTLLQTAIFFSPELLGVIVGGAMLWATPRPTLEIKSTVGLVAFVAQGLVFVVLGALAGSYSWAILAAP